MPAKVFGWALCGVLMIVGMAALPFNLLMLTLGAAANAVVAHLELGEAAQDGI